MSSLAGNIGNNLDYNCIQLSQWTASCFYSCPLIRKDLSYARATWLTVSLASSPKLFVKYFFCFRNCLMNSLCQLHRVSHYKGSWNYHKAGISSRHLVFAGTDVDGYCATETFCTVNLGSHHTAFLTILQRIVILFLHFAQLLKKNTLL